MENAKETKLNILSDSDRQKLIELNVEMEKSEKAIGLLKEMGIGVTDLEARLNWAKKRTNLLIAKG